jgi:hypothetical protein
VTWRRWLRALQPDPIGSPFDLLDRDYRTDRQREAAADRLECALIWSATQANEETT